MEQVHFRRTQATYGEVVDILVNDRPLVELVREAELADAAGEGRPDLAGKYVGLPEKALTSSLLEGSAAGIWAVLEVAQGSDRVPLLVCECGEPGCWPLMATVTFTEEAVLWHDFRQPHRKNWRYEKLGPFRFVRTQYLAALQTARSA